MLMFLVIIYRLFAVVVSAVLVDNFNAGRVAGIFDNTDVATEGASDAHTIRVNAEVDFANGEVVEFTGQEIASTIVVAVEAGISDDFVNRNDAI